MSNRDDLYSFVPIRISIGLSQIIGVTIIPSQCATTLKYLSGGTLELVSGNTLSPWGLGYPLGVNEILNANISGTYYFAASGATVTVGIIRGLSE